MLGFFLGTIIGRVVLGVSVAGAVGAVLYTIYDLKNQIKQLVEENKKLKKENLEIKIKGIVKKGAYKELNIGLTDMDTKDKYYTKIRVEDYDENEIYEGRTLYLYD